MRPNGRHARTFGRFRLARFPDIAFGAIAFLAGAIPLFRGSAGLRIHICGLPGAATYVARRSLFSSAWSQTHAPAATSLLFVAAIAGVGFSVFHASMALHGPAADPARHHFCRLSAVLAAAGAVLTIGVRAVLTALGAT